MQRKSIPLALAGILMASAGASAAGLPADTADYLSRSVHNGQFVGVIVGLIDGKDTTIKAFGVASKETGRAPDADTVFEIGSISQDLHGDATCRGGERRTNEPLRSGPEISAEGRHPRPGWRAGDHARGRRDPLFRIAAYARGFQSDESGRSLCGFRCREALAGGEWGDAGAGTGGGAGILQFRLRDARPVDRSRDRNVLSRSFEDPDLHASRHDQLQCRTDRCAQASRGPGLRGGRQAGASLDDRRI